MSNGFARVGLQIVGGVVGGLVGGPAGAAAGMAVGSLAGGIIFPDKVRNTGPRLDDLSVQASSYGEPIAIVYGTQRLAGNIIWARDIQEVKKKQKVGKGMSSKATTYTYYGTFSVAFCEGPIKSFLRVWADNKLIWDGSPKLNGMEVRAYLGSEDQMPDPAEEADVGIGNAPAYRGLARLVFENMPLEEFGNRIPIVHVEIVGLASESEKYVVDHEPEADALTDLGHYQAVSTPDKHLAVAGFDPAGTDDASQDVVIREWARAGDEITLVQEKTFAKPNAYGLTGDQFVEIAASPSGELIAILVYSGYDATHGHQVHIDVFDRASGTLASELGLSQELHVDLENLLDDEGVEFVPSFMQRIFWMDETHICLHVKSSASDRTGIIALTRQGFLITEATTILAPSGFYPAAKNPFFTTSRGDLAWLMVDLQAGSDDEGWLCYGLISADADYLAPYLQPVAGIDTGLIPAFDTAGTVFEQPGAYDNIIDGISSFTEELWPRLFRGASISTGVELFAAAGWTPETDVASVLWDDGSAGADRVQITRSATVSYFQSRNAAFYDLGYIVSFSGNTLRTIQVTADGFGELESKAIFDTDGTETLDYQISSLHRAGGTHWWRVGFGQRADLSGYGHIDLANIGLSRSGWTLKSIIEDQMARVGISPSDIDTDDIADLTITGYAIRRQTTVRAIIDQCLELMAVNAYEANGKLVFTKREYYESYYPARWLTEDDLGAAESSKLDEAAPLVTETRKPDNELPAEFSVSYARAESDYDVATQTAMRHGAAISDMGDGDSSGSVNLTEAFVLTDDEAMAIAERMLWESWNSRSEVGANTLPVHLDLDPGDVIGIEAQGLYRKIRISQIDVSPAGLLKITGVSAYGESYYQTGNGGGASLGAGTPDTGNVLTIILKILNLPTLRDIDGAEPGFYAALSAYSEEDFDGALLYREDATGEPDEIGAVDSRAVVGELVLPVAASQATTWDRDTTITVRVNGELASANEADVLSGANAMAIGGEIVQFATATLQSPGIYVLSDLIRGRKGTEWAMSHQAGEIVVLLTGTGVVRITIDSSDIGRRRHYRAVEFGGLIFDAPEQAFTCTGENLRPLSPVGIAGARDGSENLTISWKRRARVDAEWRDGVDVPLDETAEAYEIDIMDGTTVKRTISSSSSSCAYSAADQTVDFGAPQASVDVRIYQLSTKIGRGRSGQAVI